MFEIKVGQQGEIVPIGRLDASRIEAATSVFDAVTTSTTVDMAQLDYISSAGIGILLAAHKRLAEQGQRLTFVNTKDNIRELFRYTGLDKVLDFG